MSDVDIIDDSRVVFQEVQIDNIACLNPRVAGFVVYEVMLPQINRHIWHKVSSREMMDVRFNGPFMA